MLKIKHQNTALLLFAISIAVLFSSSGLFLGIDDCNTQRTSCLSEFNHQEQNTQHNPLSSCKMMCCGTKSYTGSGVIPELCLAGYCQGYPESNLNYPNLSAKEITKTSKKQDLKKSIDGIYFDNYIPHYCRPKEKIIGLYFSSGLHHNRDLYLSLNTYLI